MQVYSNELYHYGVIGMKWGIRRYQNPDGSLKAAGRKRYDQAKTAVGNAAGKVKAVVKRPVDAVKTKANSLTDEQKAKIKKGVKIGLAVAGTAIAAYGAYKIGSKAIARHNLSGKLAAERLAREYGSKSIASEFASKNGDIWGRIDTKSMGDPDSYGSQYIRNLLYRNTGYIGGKHEVYNFDPKTGKYFKFDYNWDKK